MKDNFVDRRNSTNLRLARSKMSKSKPTYFSINCAIVFGWAFHRLREIYIPLTFSMALYEVFAMPHYYSFSAINFYAYGILLTCISTTYLHKIFAIKTIQNVLILCHLSAQKFSSRLKTWHFQKRLFLC